MKQPTNINDIPQQQGASNNFIGTTFIQLVASAENEKSLVARVTFEKGARTVWHMHSGEQVLYFLEGKGRVQVGDELIDANPSDIVRIPPNTRHWHGAHPDEPKRMRHLAITYGNVIWLDPVPEEVYQK